MVFTNDQVSAFIQSDVTALSSASIETLTADNVSHLSSSQMGFFSADQMSHFTSQATGAIVSIQGITPTAIVGVTLTALTGSQVASLLDTQLYALFTNKKLSALSASQLGNMTYDQMNTFFSPYTNSTDTLGLLQLNDFSAAQVQALGTNLVIEANHFTTTIVGYMSEATQISGAFSFMNKLSNSQIAALTTSTGGTGGQIKAITAGQFASFSASQMGAFTALQAADFSSDQFLALTSTNIAGISTTAFPSIPAISSTGTYFNGISSTQLSGITTGQIAVMATGQLAQLPASAVSSASGVYVPSSAQIGALSITGATSQVASLTAAFVDAFSTTHLNYFSASQVPKIIVAAISGLSASQVSGLSATFAYALTTTAAGQLQSIVGANNTTSYDTLNAINVQDLKDHIVNLTDEQINKLSATQIGNLTAGTNDTVATAYDQIAALSTGSTTGSTYTAGKMATLFTEAQINAITPNQFKSINADEFSKFSITIGSVTTASTPVTTSFTTDHIASFKNTAIANLSTAQFAKITANNIIKFKVGSWTSATAYTTAVTYGDIQSIPTGRISELTAAQLGALTTTQIPALSLAQIAALPTTSTAMGGLTTAQVQALHYGETANPNQVAAITSNTFNALTYTQMNFFSALSSGVQVPSISTSAISNISASTANGNTNKVASLNIAFISNLWGSQLQAMSLAQVQQITATSLTNTQIISNATGASGATGGFIDEQIAWLTLSQVGVLVTSQLASLVGTRTNITAGNYPYGRLNNLKIDGLKLDPTSGISAGDYFPLSATQVATLSPANVKLLTSVHLRSFDSARVQALTIADVDATQIPYIPGNDNSATTVNNGTDYAETIAVVSYASTNTNSAATDFSSYASNNPGFINTAGTTSYFSIDQILGMSQAQVQKLTYGQLNKFSQSQIRILNTAYLLASQIPYIAINYLSDYQTGNLTMGQMLYISATQAAALSYTTVTDVTTIKLTSTADATITANGVSATVSPTATAYGQIAVLSEQQMKWFREDVVSSFIVAQINIVFSNGVNNGANKFLSLPDAQYQLLKMKSFIENSVTTGSEITSVQIGLETEFQNLARTGTSTILGITGLTILTMINKIGSAYDDVNSTSKIPDTVLHMISVTQVPFLSAARITTLKQSSKYSLLSNEVQLALDKNLLAYSTYATLKSYITTNGILSSATSITTTTALYAQVKNLSEDLKAALLTDITNGNVVVNTAISSTLTDSNNGILNATTVVVVWESYNIGSATNSQIASITPDNFALIPAAGAGANASGFANLAEKASAILPGQAAKMTIAQVKALTTISIAALSSSVIANFTDAVLTNMSATQINAMTEAQMSALTSEQKTILINIIDGGIAALNIDLTGFDTSVSAALLSATKSDAIALGSFDATATANMSLLDAKGMFKYAEGGNGKIRLYLDKSYFKIKYAYQSSTSVTVDTGDSEYSTSGQTFAYSSTSAALHWAAPVTSNDIAGVTSKVTPLSWDFIHYLASKVYGKYAAFSLFNDLNTKEAELRSTINTQVHATLSPIITAFDKVNSTSTAAGYTSFTKVSDGTDYYYELDSAITSGESKDIMSVIFNTLYKNQPARFMPVTSTVSNTKYDMPFIAGDKLQFIVSITPNSQQKVLDTATTTTINAAIPARKYKIEIAISA